MKKLLICSIVFILSVNANFLSSALKDKNLSKLEIFLEEDYQKNRNELFTLFRNDFTDDIDAIRKKYGRPLKTEGDTIRNEYEPERIDSLYIFHYPDIKYQIYKAVEINKYILWEVELFKVNIVLSEISVELGQSVQMTIEYFGKPFSADVEDGYEKLLYEDDPEADANSYIQFIFKYNKLVKLKYFPYSG
jgi:hypothetical protein